MPQVRVQKRRDFTQIENKLIQNPELSLKAKGLLIYMLSVPDDWDYSISGLSVKCKEGKSAIRNAIAELMEHGYITRSLARAEDGTLDGYSYDVYESPQPSCDFPPTVNPTSGNRTQQILTQTNTEKTNTPYSPPGQPQAAGTVVRQSRMTSPGQPQAAGTVVRQSRMTSPEQPQAAPEGDAPPPDKPKPASKRRTRRKASVPTHAPERFEQFWEVYPGGGSRLRAVAAWDALAPDDGLIDEMARALKRQMASSQWRDGVGIPHASTWLNQQRWTDKLPEAPRSQDGGWARDPEVSCDG